jgi:glycine cleavage system regulatory protein
MAGIPKVKITFDADLDELKKGVKSATGEVQSFSDRAADFGKKAALAFAVAGAAVTAFAVSAVKAAAQDEAAQKKLTDTIKATTDATAQQIASIDQYVTKTSIAAAVTDDQIRPALARLARSTGDVQEAQDLLALALDLSAASGKSLETTTNALAKANEGSNTALKKLGLGLDENYLKTASNDQIVKDLTATYGNFSENQAKTAEARFRSMSIAIEESKEAIGAALLPVAEKLATFVLETLIPALDGFIAGLTGNYGLKASLTESQRDLFAWGERVRNIIKTIVDLKEELLVIGTVIAGVFVAAKIAAFVTTIQGLVTAFIAWRTAASGAAVATAAATGGVSLVGASAGVAGAIALLAGAGIFLNRGGDDSGGSDFAVGGTPSAISGGGTGGLAGGGGFRAGGGGGAGGLSGGTGSGGSSVMTPTGATSLVNLAKRLTDVSDKFTDLQFLVDTGGISRSAGITQLNALTKEFRVLEKQANALTAPTSSGSNISSGRLADMQSMVTINMGIVGDPEGAARAVEQVFQDSLARGGISSTVGAYDR